MMKWKQSMALQGAGLQNLAMAQDERGRAAMNYAIMMGNLGQQAAGNPKVQGLFAKGNTGGGQGGAAYNDFSTLG
jgi:hypothetical protein